MPQQLEEPCDMTASGQLHFSAEAEAQWRELFEYSPVMHFMVDPAGTVLAVNAFGAAQLGYSVSEYPISVAERTQGRSMYSLLSHLTYPLKTSLILLLGVVEAGLTRRKHL